MTNQKLGPLQRKWVNYLKRNGHQQGEGSLGYLEHTAPLERELKMCCLGAAGYKILKTCIWDENEEMLFDGKRDGSTTYLNHSYKKLGLYSGVGVVDYKGDGMGCDDANSLAELNDNGVSWYEIACYMEAAPELFFTKPK
jgi:hypothetical protein